MKKKLAVDFLDEQLNERLTKSGLRFTAQRRHVFGVLVGKRDHPSAEEVFIRAKKEMPDISMATVYNTLDTLVQCGLVRQVKQERGATRFCSNMNQHHHFHCEECGGTFDIDSDTDSGGPELHMPSGFQVRNFEIFFRGLCPDCTTRKKPQA